MNINNTTDGTDNEEDSKTQLKRLNKIDLSRRDKLKTRQKTNNQKKQMNCIKNLREFCVPNSTEMQQFKPT